MKKALILIVTVLSLLLSGCSFFTPSDPPDETKPDVTDEELELLRINFGDEDLEAEDLLSAELDALYQLRAGMEYMEEKYPFEDFTFHFFTSDTVWSASAELFFREDGERYTVYITPTEDGYDCSDDYYGVLIREDYDRRLAQELADEGFDALCYTDFSSPAGMDIGAGTTYDDLFELNPKLTRMTNLFVEDTANRQALADELQAAITELGVYGSYRVQFVPSLDVIDPENMEDMFSYEDDIRFNCFDIG